ncbi:hypothetical protein P170DRAFT_361296 [Aspergillus steynii IBT 23096]|uniref:Zn(2)-C6 fungal-type domain-containing protein n=1 Tax=Aspergillus steynii IBT 23096 TaxID=1392250 RepID=A0A2I2G5J6_9EURO|nr:uncharacterized protein P170DRAFT_361296 [Aspergillus steynii IBT 23096]PLB48150.1 hypothetical protein P170DRAFT_361296 [Aspergillus steynii IBT 23096]
MPKQPKLRPKSHIPGFPDAMYDLSAISSLSQLESRAGLGDEKHDQRVFRVKRKHVLKACDRCRVKKTKCDGKQPCNRCSAYNHPCLFRERKATQTKVYSRGFVEMLESHHSLVVKALQRLYKLCINKEDFPGEPLAEAPDGYPLTHTILDRLGLIKQAEENPEEPDEDTEDLQYLRFLSTSTGCSPTTDPSPEPATPPEPSSSNCSPTKLSPKSGVSWKWDYPPLQPVNPYPNYQSFHGMAVPRPPLMPAPAEAKCPEPVHSVSDPDHPYFCYMDNNGNGELMKSRLSSGIAAEPGSHHMPTPAGMSVDILGDYNLHLHEQQQPVYHGIAPGWNFPCG